jgi:hypothetical protein
MNQEPDTDNRSEGQIDNGQLTMDDDDAKAIAV